MARIIWLTLVLLSTFISHPSTAFAQGSLTPPGVPAPTMKTLAQIEPRTPISSAPFTITESGSYYLTTNIAVGSGDAILIGTNGVTLDLNGFTISSTEVSPTGTGILLASNITDIAILNGHIRGGIVYSGGSYSGGGFANGIYYSSSPPLNVRVTGITVSDCLFDGIHLGTVNSSVVESCNVLTVGGYGIVADGVFRSTAKTCGTVAINASSASDCNGSCSGSGDGVDVAFTAHNCIGSSGSGAGLNATTANNCYGLSGTGIGLTATTVNHCYGLSYTYIGINATTANNCYGYSYGTGAGVHALFTQNCYGESSSGHGITGTSALNCIGISNGGGRGVYVIIAQNCWGRSVSSYGLWAEDSATGCHGLSQSGTGLFAFIANVCHGDTLTGTALTTLHNVNSY